MRMRMRMRMRWMRLFFLDAIVNANAIVDAIVDEIVNANAAARYVLVGPSIERERQ